MGKKGASIALRSKLKLVADYPANQLETLVNNVVDQYRAGEYSSVWIAYAKFINTMTQQPEVIQFLAGESGECVGEEAAEAQAIYTFEPSPARCWNTSSPNI